MSTTLQEMPATKALTAPEIPVNGPAHGILLHGVRWETYEALRADLAYHRSIRLTYDNGSLQIMSPLPQHERYSIQLGQFVRVLASATKLPYCSFGQTTYKREDLQKGLEPDNCFYLANLPRVLDKRTLDLAIDPAPDLAIEIDMTSNSIPRLPIYAALGVGEVWRFDGQILKGHHLGPDGHYRLVEFSPTFPFLRLADVVPFLHQVFAIDEGSLTEAFRAWLEKEILPPWRKANS